MRHVSSVGFRPSLYSVNPAIAISMSMSWPGAFATASSSPLMLPLLLSLRCILHFSSFMFGVAAHFMIHDS